MVPEDKRGSVIPADDPLNPIKERSIGVPHRTAQSRHRHPRDRRARLHRQGRIARVIRMLPEEVIELYDDVPLGTTIAIA